MTTDGPPLEAPSAPTTNVPTHGTVALAGTVWTTASLVAPFAYTFVVNVVATRVLTLDAYGRQSFIAFVVLSATGIAAGGLSSAVTRYVAEKLGAERRDELPGLVTWIWRIAFVVAALGGIGILAIALAGAAPQLAWSFAAVAVFCGTLHKLVGSILLGGRRFRVASMISLHVGVWSTVATIVVLVAGGGISGMLGVLAASVTAMLVLASVQVRRMLAEEGVGRHTHTGAGALPRAMLTFGLVSSLPYTFKLIVAQRSEVFFLDRFSSNDQIAYYAVAFSVIAALLAIPAAVQQVMSPTIATLVGAGAFDRIRVAYGRALRLLLLLSLPLTGLAVALGPAIIQLVFGRKYAAAGSVLLVLVSSIPLIPVTGASEALLIGYRRMRFPLLNGVVAAAIDIVVAWLLVPRLDALGAALANASAQVAAAGIALIYCSRLVGGVELRLASFWRMIVVSAVAVGAARGILVVVGGAPGLVLAFAVGVALFAALGATLGVLPREDAQWLAASTTGRGQFVGRLCLRLSH